jgi:outer membrane lipoprotein-sorting protein
MNGKAAGTRPAYGESIEMLLSLKLVLTLILGVLTSGAAEVSGVEACAERKRPAHSSVQTVELRSVDASGLETRLQARVLWKRLDEGRLSAVMRLLAPDDVAGMSFLVRQSESAKNEMFIYLPEMQRVRRVSARQASGALFGSAFSYEDFQRIQGLADDTQVGSGRDAKLDGRDVYVLKATPQAASASAYRKIVAHVDRETCLPLKVEYHDSTDELAKVLTADPAKFAQVNGVWIARSLSMKDIEEEMVSHLEISEVEIDGDLPDRYFAPASLADDL